MEEIIEKNKGRYIDEIMEERILEKEEMKKEEIIKDKEILNEWKGYEGDKVRGLMKEIKRIKWIGDEGIWE